MEDFQYSTTPSSQFVQQSVFRSSSNQQPQAYNNSSLSAFCSTDSTSSQQSFSNASSIHQHQYAAVNSADSSNDIKPGTLLLRNINNNSNVSNFDLSDHQAGRNTISSSYPPLSLTYANNSAAGSNAKANNSAQRAKTNAPRTHDHISPLVVCATRMDRLSPYGNYDDSRNGANLAGLSLDQIFKTNTNDDSDRNDSVGRGGGGGGGGQTNNDAILLLNQNIECLKQAYANGNQNSNGSLGPSSSPTTSTISNMSNLDVNNQLSSPPTSTSPSSSTDTPSTYGTLTNTILNGALTPPPDNSANSLTSDSVVSSSVYNPYSVKGVQLQHSHHHHHQSQLASLKLSLNGGNGANLVNLVPSNNNNNNNNPNANNSANNLMANLGTHLGNSTSASHGTAQMLQQQTNAVNSNNNGMGSGMMSILQPSKPLNISELSNCSLMSSTSSSGSSTLDTPGGGGSNGTSKRARGSKSNDGGDQKDGKYFERRKRNNVAAKKSRDARKQREDEIAIRASFLEKENSILKAQLQTLKDEAQQLRILLAQKKSSTASLASTSSCSNCSNCSAMVAAAAAAVNGVNGGLVGVGGPIGGCHNNNNGNGNNKPSQQGNGLVNGMMSHGGYASSNLNNLAAQLNSYEHSDLVDKQQQVVLNSASQAASAANASIYLQHQNQHRHSII